jgi:hypothetical protein
MKNREELTQKGHDKRKKTTCREREKNIIFRSGGGGVNIILNQNIDPWLAQYTL